MPVAGKSLELVSPEVSSSVVVGVVFVVEVVVAAAVAVDLGEVGGPNHSVTRWGTLIGDSGLWWGWVMATQRDSIGSAFD